MKQDVRGPGGPRFGRIARRTFRTLVLGAAAVSMVAGASALAQGLYEITVAHRVEAERRVCTNCPAQVKENAISSTPVEVSFSPGEDSDLSFGFAFAYDTDSEGSFLGAGRRNIDRQGAFEIWASRELNDTFTGGVQAEYGFLREYIDLGARLEFSLDTAETSELSGFISVDRRFEFGPGSRTADGTLIEASLTHSWDWDRFGAWVSADAELAYLEDGKEDEFNLALQPGVWFQLGDSAHRGLFWLEGERNTNLGASDYKQEIARVGIGAEFDFDNGRLLEVGLTVGRERTRVAGQAEQRANHFGIFAGFEQQF